MPPTTCRERDAGAPSEAQIGWSRFLTQLQKDAKLWLVVFFFLWLFRWVMIFLFRDQSTEAMRMSDLLKCAYAGGRCDSVAATYCVLPCILFSVGAGFWGFVRLAERVRLIAGILFLVLGSLVCATAIGFFQEYKDRFNQWIFGVIYDDLGAILKTIWGPNAVDQPEHLRVLVNALRRKLERDPAKPQYIKTEPWVGYRFSEE